MKKRVAAIRLVFLPFLIASLCFGLVYSLVHWLIIILWSVAVESNLVSYGLPFVLALVPVFTWLRPRIRLLNSARNNHWALYFLAVLAIGLPTTVTQHYLTVATGKLSHLNTITQYETQGRTKYYTIQNYYADKRRAAVLKKEYTSGKRDEYLNMDIFIAVPVLVSEADTQVKEPLYWVGQKYALEISSRLPESDKEEQLEAFDSRSMQEFETVDFHRITYWEIMPGNSDRNRFREAIQHSGVALATPIVFIPGEGDYVNRTKGKLKWALISWGIAAILWFLIAFASGVQPGYENIPQRRKRRRR